MENTVTKKDDFAQDYHRTILKKSYDVTVDKYTEEFCNMYELHYDPDAWVAGERGGIIEIADYWISFDDIRYCVDNDVDWEEFVAWYDYVTEIHALNVEYLDKEHALAEPNLKSWLKGCPRISKDKIRAIHDSERKITAMKSELIDMISGLKNNY